MKPTRWEFPIGEEIGPRRHQSIAPLASFSFTPLGWDLRSTTRYHWLMRRTNELVAHTTTQQQRRCLCEWFVANCALWNQHTYRRRQAYFDPDGDVWAIETADLYDTYAPVTGTGTAQQVKRKNDDAWSSFFEQLEDYHAGTHGEKPSPPGYWGTREDGYELRGLVRKDLYEVEGGDGTHSMLSFGVGEELKAKYGMETTERLSLPLQGNPRWRGEDCRLELAYDETADCIRVHHTVEVQPGYIETLRQREFTHTPEQGNAAGTAAIDVGANNTLAVLTDSGHEVTRDLAHPLAEAYRRPWGIETSYRKVAEFLPRTSSPTFSVRLFYFLFAVALYNLWVLVNLLVTPGRAVGSDPVLQTDLFR